MSQTNVVLTIPEPGRFELVERPYPRIKAGYAVVRTEIAPVCMEGSRIWAAHDFEFHDDPTHLGHEGVGVIEDIHAGSSLKKGDRAIVFQGDHCGHCHSCRNGLSPTYCVSNLTELGGRALHGIEEKNDSESGGFAMARYRIAPLANVYKIPDQVDFRHAAACNCSFGVGFSNHEIMNVKAGDTVLVGGVGFIGMGHIISALYRNATVIALMRNPYREALLRKMGVGVIGMASMISRAHFKRCSSGTRYFNSILLSAIARSTSCRYLTDFSAETARSTNCFEYSAIAQLGRWSGGSA